MKIQFLVLVKNNDDFKVTFESVKEVSSDGDIITVIKETADQLYYNIPELKPECDFVCIIPNGSTLEKNYKELIEDYKEEGNTVYLPLTLLVHDKVKGMLNSCVWKYSTHQEDYGVLTPELALKQIDTTLYGALVPMKAIIDVENYDPELKYYQHFRILNSLAHKEDYLILGVPKLLVSLNYDLSYQSEDEKEKVENYKKANRPWAKKESEVVILNK